MLGSPPNLKVEAQCLVRHYNYNPGAIDGVFGSNSQSDMNNDFGHNLKVDGRIGPNSWPLLRSQP